MRAIGLDLHLDFCELAISEDGAVRSAGRIEATPEQIDLSARSLGAEDRVALEVTGDAWEIKRILEPHAAEVVVVSPSGAGIRQARAKTDRLERADAGEAARFGELDAVSMPDRATWRTAPAPAAPRPAGLGPLTGEEPDPRGADALPGRSRPVLRSLRGQGPGLARRAGLPEEERETVDSALRQVDFLDREIDEVERLIASAALESPEIRRLMTVPGVNVIVAATFLAAIGDIRRFESPRKLVGYLGLDPRVRQSGSGPAAHGRISKQGSIRARHTLVEASWSTVRQPGPIRAFYERIRVRRGHQVAVVACARKLACLFWCLLSRSEDYAYAQPSLTRKKLRRLELAAGAPSKRGTKSGPMAANAAMRKAERELARQAEVAYRRTVADWQQAQGKKGAGATPGRASRGPSSGQAARQVQAPGPAL